MGILETLDGIFSLHSNEEKLISVRPNCLKVATELLTLPTPPLIQIHSKAVLSSLHSTKQQYHSYKDQALLQHVLTSITAMTSAEVIDLDAESYYRLILIVRGIAISRPQNLVKFTDGHTSIQDVVLDDPLESTSGEFLMTPRWEIGRRLYILKQFFICAILINITQCLYFLTSLHC